MWKLKDMDFDGIEFRGEFGTMIKLSGTHIITKYKKHHYAYDKKNDKFKRIEFPEDTIDRIAYHTLFGYLDDPDPVRRGKEVLAWLMHHIYVPPKLKGEKFVAIYSKTKTIEDGDTKTVATNHSIEMNDMTLAQVADYIGIVVVNE